MKQIQESLNLIPHQASLTRSYKVKQIQDGLKTDPAISFIYGVNCEMKQIQNRLKPDPVIDFIDV
jgi:hypothetical protein